MCGTACRLRPTIDLRPTITYGGVVWAPAQNTDSGWYYHYREGVVYPRVAYNSLHGAGHGNHAVLPVEPVSLVDTHEDEINDARKGHP